jgi:hypothetical protein
MLKSNLQYYGDRRMRIMAISNSRATLSKRSLADMSLAKTVNTLVSLRIVLSLLILLFLQKRPCQLPTFDCKKMMDLK